MEKGNCILPSAGATYEDINLDTAVSHAAPAELIPLFSNDLAINHRHVTPMEFHRGLICSTTINPENSPQVAADFITLISVLFLNSQKVKSLSDLWTL